MADITDTMKKKPKTDLDTAMESIQETPAPVTPPVEEVKEAPVAEPVKEVVEEPVLAATAPESKPVPEVAAPVVEAPATPATPVAPKPVELAQYASDIQHSIYDRLKKYLSEMAPNRQQSTQSMLNNQVMLFRLLTDALNFTENEFSETWTAILNTVNANRNGAFSFTKLYRGFDNIPLSHTERAAFMQLLNLVTVTCDPKARPLAKKQIDFTKVLNVGFSDRAIARIHNFYEV